MNIKKLGYSLLLLGCMCEPVLADSMGKTVYAGGGLAVSKDSDICGFAKNLDNIERAENPGIEIPNSNCDDTNLAHKFVFGYRINPYAGFEFTLTKIKGAEIEFKDINDEGDIVSTGSLEEDVERFSIDALGFWPISGNVYGLGKIGYGKNTFKLNLSDFDDVNSNGLSAGIGVSLSFSDVELRVELERIFKVDAGKIDIVYDPDGRDSYNTLETDITLFGIEAMMHFH